MPYSIPAAIGFQIYSKYISIAKFINTPKVRQSNSGSAYAGRLKQVEAEIDVFPSDIRHLLAGFVFQVLDKVIDLVDCHRRVFVPDLFVYGVVHRNVITEEGGLDCALRPQNFAQVIFHSLKLV
jgi:hypothetical protein